MSAALDTMSTEDQAELDAMRAADATPSDDPAPPAADTPPADSVPAPDAAPDGQPTQPKTVPLEALQAERKRASELQKQMAELERNQAAANARLEERLALLTQAAQMSQPPAVAAPPAAPETPPPDPNADPMGYVNWAVQKITGQVSAIGDRVANVERFATQGQQQTEQQRQTQALVAWGQSQEAEFARTQPDYEAATTFLRQSRTAELQAAGVMSPMEINAAVAQDTLGLAMRARQTAQNFGRLIYQVAQARGYKPADSAAPTGVAATPAAADPATAAAAMERATKGATMAPGLPSGGAPRGEPTAQALANMSEQQFGEYLAKVAKNPAALRQLFGE